MHFFFDLSSVGKYKEQNNFEHVLYPLLIKPRRKKLFEKMDSSKKTTVKLSRKIDLRGSRGRIFLNINTNLNTHILY